MVTGASSGVGTAFARQLASAGFNVALVARREDRLRALAADVAASSSAQTRVVVADLSGDDFLPLLQEATDDLEIGLLVNNAGAVVAGDFLANDLGAELAMLQLNCRAPLLLTHHFGRHMQRQGRGAVIFVSSIVAFTGVPVWSHYAATKGHNLLFAEGLAPEFRQSGVDVLAVCPAFVRTEFMQLTRLGRMLSMDAEAVVKVALRNLGKRRVVTAGLLNKLIVWSTRLPPRALNTKIFRIVIEAAYKVSE